MYPGQLMNSGVYYRVPNNQPCLIIDKTGFLKDYRFNFESFYEKPLNQIFPRFENCTGKLGDFTVNAVLLVFFGANILPPCFAWMKILGVRYLASMEHLTHKLMLC